MTLSLSIAVIVVILLTAKIWMMKHAAKEILEQFSQKLNDDTNTIICLRTVDRDMCALADALNQELLTLRKQHYKYTEGDRELKNAITNISHDLRTPLTAITSYLDLLESHPENQTQYLSVIRNRTAAMTALTEELFRYSIVLHHETEIDIEPIIVNTVLEDVLLGYYASLAKKKITPKITITEEKVICKANRAALSRVFANLVSNALKYSTGEFTVEMHATGVITFSNPAPELSTIQVGRLFDRFYTTENARKTTGLGLSIAKTLMEEMHGDITADYHHGILKITVTLPVANPE